EKMPELKGGLRTLMTKINYPEEAAKAGIEGRVIVKFIVNKQGNVDNPQIMRGVSEALDQEALRVVNRQNLSQGNKAVSRFGYSTLHPFYLSYPLIRKKTLPLPDLKTLASCLEQDNQTIYIFWAELHRFRFFYFIRG